MCVFLSHTTDGQCVFLYVPHHAFFCFPHNNVPFITPAVMQMNNEGNGASSSTTPQITKEPQKEENGGRDPEQLDGSSSTAGGNSTQEKKSRLPKKTRVKRKRVSCADCVHNVWTHFPKDPNCEIVKLAKPTERIVERELRVPQINYQNLRSSQTLSQQIILSSMTTMHQDYTTKRL